MKNLSFHVRDCKVLNLNKRIKINMKLHSQPILILQCDLFPIEIVNINMSEQHLQYVSVRSTNKALLKKQRVCVVFFSLMDVEESESMCWSSISPELSPLMTEEPR